jgi:serine/threonine protein kinase
MNNRKSFSGRYEIQQQLGKKAGRQTLLVRDSVTGELAVVKLLTFGSEFVWDDLKLFEREAQTLKSLSHRCIPRYLDYFEVNSPEIKGFALVQTYIPAKTLEYYLKTGRSFTEAEVKEIAKSLLEILIYLHGLNPPVIHRDIKPSNILLGERSGNSVGKVYLVDFGSVQTVLAAEGGTRTIVGTYGYMPLEQFGGRTVPASDLYSLGATLIYLVTGTQPADLPQKDFCIQFESRANLSPHFSRWLKSMTEASLEKRLGSAKAALNALEDISFSSARATLTALEDASFPDATLTVGKPAGSKIQLTKNDDALEIFIPPIGFHLSMVFTGLFAVIWNLLTLLWTMSIMLAPSPGNTPPVLFLLASWSWGFYMIYGLLFSLFGINRLRIDQTQIIFTYELLGFKFHFPSSRESIIKLVYIPAHFTKDSEGSQTRVLAELNIWAGVKKYKLGGSTKNIKSDAELEWLAEELSNWLDMEITREPIYNLRK